MILHPHIHFNGNTEKAFQFYHASIGGELQGIMRFHELNSAEFSFPEEEGQKLMQIQLVLHHQIILSGSDVPAMLGIVNESENRSKICLRANSQSEAEALFLGLSAGGEVEFPMGDSPWGTYFGAFRDQFGVEWMIEA